MSDLRLAIRNLCRNRWRSGLTLAGVAVSVALMVWTLAFIEGWLGQMVRGATAVETGQLQVHTAAYVESPRVYHAFPAPDSLLAAVEAVEGVEAVTPRVRLHGLVGHERKSRVARIIGVEPRREARATPIEEGVTEGRWLAPDPPARPAPREVVVGGGMARQLGVGPGAELVVFLEAADGSLGNELLRVVGVVETGNTAVDQMTAYLHLDDARYLAALEGEVHELAIRVGEVGAVDETARAVVAALGSRARRPGRRAGSEGLVVRTWREILPGVSQVLAVSRQSYWFMYLLVYLVGAVGILNTQRMSALERHREFGVMVAVGMRPRRLFRTVLVETGVLGVAGGIVGAALGLGVSWYHATAGLDMTLFSDQAAFTYMGVSFSERIYADLTWMAALQPPVVMVLVAVASGLWPAVRSARIDPAPTIAGRTG